VSRSFGDRPALVEVDLTVAQGSVHGLLGPNGAGKTTLLRVLLGLVGPDEGTLEVLGHGLDDPHRLDGVAGFVEVPRFWPYLSGRRNLDLLAALDGTPSAARQERVTGALEQVGLTDRAEDRAGGYSLGMRQRLGIASALLREPSLLVLDEPANGLDPAGARDLRALIHDLADQGMTVLLSSHDMAEVDELCDAVTILAGGMVLRTGSMQQLRREAPPPQSVLRTSNDEAALALAARQGLPVAGDHFDGLRVDAAGPELDAFVLALARSGIAVRGLAQRDPPLERLFFALTSGVTR